MEGIVVVVVVVLEGVFDGGLTVIGNPRGVLFASFCAGLVL
jgi:hypothetical protein